MIRSAIVIVVLLLAGCDFALVKPPAEPTLRYVLQIPEKSSTETINSAKLHGVVYVPDSTAAPHINSTKLLFEKQVDVVDFYKYALWSEATTTRFATLIAQRLEDSKVFSIVTRRNGPASADYVLDSEILDFYHDATYEPGTFKVRVAFTLTDMSTRKILRKSTYSHDAKLESYDAFGAVKAAAQAAHSVIEEALGTAGIFSSKM